MKALLKAEKNDGKFTIRDVPRPQLEGENDVIIKITGSGICGTDVHILHEEFPYWPPVIIGHEFVGIVEAVGSNVTNVKPGDRVVGEPHTRACGVCDLCRQGKIQLCTEKRAPGWGIDGANARYLRYPEPNLLHLVPDNVPDEVAVLAEPLAIVVHEVLERGRVEAMDYVAIVGAGPIGILAAFVAKAAGAAHTVLLGVDADEPLRFKIAKELGVDETINVLKEDAPARILAATRGKGADLVIECSGAEAGINTAIDCVRKCGRICVVGIPGAEKVSIKWKAMINKVLDVIFNFSSSFTSWDRALSVMATTPYDLSKLVTHRVSLDEWESVFADIAAGKCLKGVFVPADE